LIKDFGEKYKSLENDVDRAKKSEQSLQRSYDKSLVEMKKSQELLTKELKSQSEKIRKELDEQREKNNKDRQQYQKSNLELKSKIVKFEQELILANENYSQAEVRCDRLNLELNELEKKRRSQLLELGVLREKERQETDDRNVKTFQKAQMQLQNEFKVKMEEALHNQKRKQKKDLAVIESQMKDLEKNYREKTEDFVKHKNRLEKELFETKAQKDKNERKMVDKMQNITSSFQKEQDAERMAFEDRSADLYAQLEMEKGRCERLERQISQMEINHRNELDDMKLSFTRQRDSIPSSIEADFENTIAGLKQQVRDLHATVKYLQSQRTTQNSNNNLASLPAGDN